MKRFLVIAGLVVVLLLVSAFAVAESASYRQVGPIEDVSYARIKRVSARIVIPPGFSRHELESILRDAAVDIGRRERASATMIFAYRSQDVGKSIGRTPWTVGRAVYAPNGRWEDAGENGPMKVSIELGEVYFRKAPTSIPKRGDEVSLFAKYKKSVEVSRLRDAWGEANIVAKVPSGTKAHVVERYEEAFTSTDMFVRYLIKTKVQGKVVQGWVWGFQVKEIAATFDQRKLVKQVQEQLIAEGFDPGPADGIFGLQTKKALRSYQAKHGLSLTGELDGTTLKALGLSDGEAGKGSPAAATTKNVYKTGETVTVGHTSYAVWRAWWSLQLNDQFADATFLFIELTVRNNDKKARRVPPFKLIDETGAEYDISSKAWRVEKGIRAQESLNPGVSRLGRIVFDVPRWRRYKLKVSGGFSSAGDALIELDPEVEYWRR